MRATTTSNPAAALLSQRREDYRLEVPADDEAFCTFKFVRKFERALYSVTLEIRDVSAGGLSVADYDRQLMDVVGSTVKSCELRLPNQHRPLLVNLKVLHEAEEPFSKKLAVSRVGCQLVDPSDTVGLAIRRYIAELERRQIAQRRGLD